MENKSSNSNLEDPSQQFSHSQDKNQISGLQASYENNYNLDDQIEASPNSKIESIKKPWYKNLKIGKLLTLIIIVVCIGLFLIAGYFGYAISAGENSVFGNGSEDGILKQLTDGLGLIADPNKTLELKGQDKGRTNFLLLGRDATAGGITDTIILGSYYHDQKTIITTNIPRDVAVYDGQNRNGTIRAYKINAAYVFGQQKNPNNGGETAIVDLISNEFDIEIHYWATIDIPGLIKGIDEIGGVEVEVEKTFTEVFPKSELSREKLADCERTVIVEGGSYCEFTFFEGKQILDGETANIYARGRKYSNDFQRSKRQSQVIKAILNKSREESLVENAANANFYLNLLADNFKTNLTVPEVVSLSRTLEDVDLENDYLINTWATGNGFLCAGGGVGSSIVYCGGAYFGSNSNSTAKARAKSQIQNLLSEISSQELLESKVLVIGNRSSETEKIRNQLINLGFSNIVYNNTYSEITAATETSIEIVDVYIPESKYYNLYQDLEKKPETESLEKEIPQNINIPAKDLDAKLIFWVDSI